MNKPTVSFFGSSRLSAVILKKMIASGDYRIKTVVTRADKPVGRKKEMMATPVAELAEKAKTTVLKPAKLDPQFIEEKKSLLVSDLVVVAAYGKIIPQPLLDLAKYGNINVHGSLLPRYRGASPIQAAILNGDDKTGVTIMLMDAEMDHGAMLAKSEILISKFETFATLEQKMAAAGAMLLLETLPRFVAGQIEPEVQDETQTTYCKLISKSDGYFEIDNLPSPEKLDRMIRAYYPWPNVWTRWNGKVVKFYPEGKVQMEGKNIVSRAEFLRGYPKFPIKQF